MAKDYEKANAIFKEVTTNPDISPVALKYYAYSLIEQDKNEEAKAVLEKYFKEAKPEDIQASDYSYYGKLLLKLDQDSLANESFAQSISLDSTQTEIIELRAKTYSKNKKYPEAIEAYKMLINSRPSGALSQDLYSLGLAYYFTDQFMEADSAFTQLSERQPEMTIGYLWAGRARQNIDSTGVQGLAKPMYDSVVTKALQDPEKYKKDLIEAYDYLGTYTLQIKNDVNAAKAYFEKILSLDPNNERAKEFMKQLKG
jgi:tetratricopeptide (TPR) repeat protein